MSRNKKSETPHYELLYVVSNKYTEDELKPIISKVHSMVKDSGGEITYQEEWGKKKFSYPIRGFNYGYYSLVEFNVVGEKVKEIDRALRMSGEILRHQIVNKENKTQEEREEEKKKSEQKAAEEIKKEDLKLSEEKVKDEDVKKEKINLQDLDEKLDKILETDDLL